MTAFSSSLSPSSDSMITDSSYRITDFLESLQLLSAEEIALINGLTTLRTIKKGEFLIKEGEVCDEVVYIQSGIVRSFYTTEEGNEITYCITFQHTFMTALSSLISGQPTPENIQAITETVVEVLPKRQLENLYASSTGWLALGTHLTEQQYIELEKRVFSFQKDSARKRYEELVRNNPRYVQQIPLHYLASYLGITPRHLSRLRSEFVL